VTAEIGELSPDQIKAAMKAMRQIGKALGRCMEQLPTVIESVQAFMEKVSRTLLAGWPTEVLGWPTRDELARIALIHDELSLHEPEVADERLWYLAGQCVARMRRDLPDGGAA
jgi:hypothetical protein